MSVPSGRKASGRRSPEEPADPGRDLGPDADPESVARTIVLTKLTGQARTRHELATALAQRNVPEDVAAKVLDRFTEVGLVDDAAFAEAWVDSRRSTRGLSRRALSQELRRKGIADEVIRDSVDRVSTDDEIEAARELVRRKLRSLGSADQPTKMRRLTGLLARKGYSAGVAYKVVREELAADAELDGDDDWLPD